MLHRKARRAMLFKTLDCFSNKITDESITMADLDYGYNIANPAAGPVYIEGAEPGDVLVSISWTCRSPTRAPSQPTTTAGRCLRPRGTARRRSPSNDGFATFNQVRSSPSSR